MDILDLKVLKGPNYWSNHWQQLIVLKIDLQEYEELPTNLLEGFTDRLKKLIPSLYQHHCSLGVEGGFFQRLNEGTWLGHVIEHVALELQYLAGMKCGFGRTRAANKRGTYHVVIEYEIEDAGLYATKAAINLVCSLIERQQYKHLEEDIRILKEISSNQGLGISTKAILDEAKKRNIPFARLDKHSLIRLGQGCKQKLISATLTSATPCLSADIVSDKNLTKEMLASAFIPVPKGSVVSSIAELDAAILELGFPLVIKPLNGNHGRGITTHITDREQAITALKTAERISKQCIVERSIKGFDYRFLVINYKLVAVAKRIPAYIVGNGQSNIKELIDEINRDPARSLGHENILSKIQIDDITLAILRENNLNLSDILPINKVLYLKYAANISSGGTAIDVTERTHPKNIFLAERIARLMHLDICGIDIMTENISAEISEDSGAVIEVNAAPGLRMHLSPSKGRGINVAQHVIDMLYPEKEESRIPLIAITGTNGKTTTARLIAHFAAQASHKVGLTTTDGIYIDNNPIFFGDCSGPQSAQTILNDPLVSFAVLECARGGIIRSGLGFDQCDISILTNISEDHLGIDDIECLSELARVKSVVVRSTKKTGYAILNADDDLVFAMKDEVTCNIALFSMQANNPRIIDHCQQGGVAAYIENNTIIIYKHGVKIPFAHIHEAPITCNGTAHCMIANILPAVLAGILCNFSSSDLKSWLKNFSSEKIPGRMNLFDLDKVKILVDYAHNAGAMLELQQYLSAINCGKKIGIIGSPGDRRAEDIKRIGFYAAQMFDEIIIRHDVDGRGRTNEEITDLLLAGISNAQKKCLVTVISDEHTALLKTLEQINSGDFIVYCPEDVFKAINFLRDLESSPKFHQETL